MYTYIHTCMYTHICYILSTYITSNMYTYVYMYTYIHTCIYTHTYYILSKYITLCAVYPHAHINPVMFWPLNQKHCHLGHVC